VVTVFGYRSGGPDSIPGTTRKKVVGLERGPLSLVSTTEELLDRKVAASVQKTENTAVRICHADHVAPSIRKMLAITSPKSGGRSVGIVRSRTQTMEFSLVLVFSFIHQNFRNEYQESFRGVKSGRLVRQIHRHQWVDCQRNVVASMSHNPMGLHSLLQG
jgi:hypothetical protein